MPGISDVGCHCHGSAIPIRGAPYACGEEAGLSHHHCAQAHHCGRARRAEAQKALVALRKDLGKDVSKGARELYDDLGKFIKDARRDSGKLSTALRKDLEALQKRLAASGNPAAKTRSTARRSTSAKRTTGRRTAAKRK